MRGPGLVDFFAIGLIVIGIGLLTKNGLFNELTGAILASMGVLYVLRIVSGMHDRSQGDPQ